MLYTSPGVLGANAIPEILITADGYNVDLSVLARAHGWNGVSPFKARVIVQAGVKIGSRSTATAALTTGSLPATSQIELINNGIIVGKGGDGERGSPNTSPVGHKGGPALKVDCFVKLDNTNGLIGGGGGGGARGAYGTHSSGANSGGGAGRLPGRGLPADRHGGGDNSHTASQAGTLYLGGAQGISGSEEGGRYGGGGAAGRGGNLGQPGANGGRGNLNIVGSRAGTGGVAGAAIVGITRVSFIARGDIRGPEVT